MKLKFTQPHISITKFNDVELPKFVVLTGVNGSGKTHLLQAIEQKKAVIEGKESASIAYFNYETFKVENEGAFNTQQILSEKNDAFNFFNQQIKNNILSWKSNLGFNYHKLYSLCEAKSMNLWSLSEDDIKDNEIWKQLSQYKTNVENLFNNNFKDNHQAQGIFYLIKRLPYSIDDISSEKFSSLYRPIYLKNDFLPQQIGKIMWDYYVDLRNNEINEYQNEKHGKNYPFISWDEFNKKHGEKPWDVINKILIKFSSLDYRVNSPEGLDYFGNFQLRLTSVKEGIEIGFDNLSSGERALMALVASIYKSSSDNYFPDILLLDEVDASLHPSMIKNLLEVIEEIFLKKNVSVILVTHSPTTVAIAPEEAIFVMNKHGEDRLEKKSKNEALRILTEGFATLDEGIKLFDQVSRSDVSIITEGKNTEYIKKACEFFGSSLNVEIVNGAEGSSGVFQLKTLFDFFSRINHDKKVIFVWDCDVISESKIKNLQEKNNTIPFIFDINNENTKVQKGIENLFPEELFREEFYFEKETVDGYGGTNKIQEFDKDKFRKFILNTNNEEQFNKFKDLFNRISGFK